MLLLNTIGNRIWGVKWHPHNCLECHFSKSRWVKAESQGHSVFESLYRVRPYVTTTINTNRIYMASPTASSLLE